MVANRKGGFVGSPRGAGLPDLFLLHDDPPRLVIAEVKGAGGKLSPKQQEFLKAARDVADICAEVGPDGFVFFPHSRPVGVYAWTPNQQEQIESLLRGKLLS